MWSVLFCISLFALTASAQVHETATVTDSLREANVYTRAIAEYVKAVYKKDQSRFDTLFLGKHADFPDIELPANIENTNVRLVMPEDGLTRLQEGKSLAFVNMAGTVTEDSAEFVLVTFSGGGRHEYDYFVDFKFNTEQREFETVDSRFENYVYDKDGKLERIVTYEDGKIVGDKPVKEVNR
jgi:hypothetical protein